MKPDENDRMVNLMTAIDTAIAAADDWAGTPSIGRQKHIYNAMVQIPSETENDEGRKKEKRE